MHGGRCRRLATALVVLGLVAGACTSSTDDASTDGTTTTAAPATSSPPTGGPAASGGPTTTAAESLTATYRGVTEDSIAVGMAAVDLEQVNETFGLDFTIIPAEEMLQAWADTLNEAGGVNGRDLVIDYRPFQPVGAEDADRVCLELMEDEETFVVIGQFLQDTMLCITRNYGHPYVGHFGETPERQTQSDGLFFAVEIAQVDQRAGGTQAMIDAGDFDGKKVAVTWESAADEVYAEAVRPVLEAGGIDVVVEIEVDAFTTDEVNNDAAWDIAIERIQASDADVILNLSGIVGVLDAAERNGAPQTIAHTNGQAADGTTVLEESLAEEAVLENSFAITTWKPDADESLQDPEVQRCLAEFQAAFPDIEPDLENTDWVNGLRTNCQAFALTVQILEAAGPDLTPESFRAAGEGLGEIDLPAMPGAFLGPDKHSAGALLSRYEYDATAGAYVKVGEPISTR